MDRLVARLERLRSVGRQILLRIGWIDGLDEKVLRIGVGGGDAPGDRLVLAEQHDGQARHGRALDRAFGRHDPCEIPQDRRAEFEMRIVGEMGLPVVVRAPETTHSFDAPWRSGSSSPSCSSGSRKDAWLGLRPARWLSARRAARRKIQATSSAGSFFAKFGAHDLELVIVAELQGHQLAPDERVRGFQGSGLSPGARIPAAARRRGSQETR